MTGFLNGVQLVIPVLGENRYPSPLADFLDVRKASTHYVEAADRVLVDDTVESARARAGGVDELPAFNPGGPRRTVYFHAATTRAAIVTCGGLCPGLNDVIRGIVLELAGVYGVRSIVGFRDGFRGLRPESAVVELDVATVRDIDELGGTILGTSRGAQDPVMMVDRLVAEGIDVLFVIGGDGSQRGALAIADEVGRRGMKLAVVGVPKTIDNDIPFIDQSFGFQTAFSRAAESIRAASVEARGAPNGVGMVKLMGRHSGFIACYAALAKNDADFVLIPEVPFRLDGENGFLASLRRLVQQQGHAVVVLAEGAGQDLTPGAAAVVAPDLNPGVAPVATPDIAPDPPRGTGRAEVSAATDASGNRRLHDIGELMQRRVTEDFATAGVELNLRYMAPSYAIRSVPANAFDSVYCVRLAHAAVHAAMAGKTAMVVGRWHGRFVHVPIELVVSMRNTVDPDGDLWLSVLEATGQPRTFG